MPPAHSTLPATNTDTSTSSALPAITRQQKAAIIVRVLLNEGATLSLTDLPDKMQQDLALQMGSMRSITHNTLAAVVDEFINELDSMGLSFVGGLEGALSALDGTISSQAVEQVRQEAGVDHAQNPWDHVTELEAARLLPAMENESVEIAAIILSKLNVSKASELLGMLSGERARRITYAMSQTGEVTPDAMQRIGRSLVSQLGELPLRAFDDGPVERVGAILNFSQANTRDEVLAGLDKDDQTFANRVRKAIFTFANIPARIEPRDVPKITRGVDQAILVTALTAASAGDFTQSTEFILENISKRMADGIREEMNELGQVKEAIGEEAMGAVVAEIRELEAAGEISFIIEDDSEDE